MAYADILRSTLVSWDDVADFIDQGSLIYGGTSGGSANAQTLTTDPTFTGYITGMSIRFKAGATSTSTTPTININSIGANTLKRLDGSACIAGDITSGEVYDIWYDGSNWRVLNPCTAWKTWTPTLGGFSADPASATYRYRVGYDRKVTAVVRQPNNGTSNSTSFTITSPIVSANVGVSDLRWGAAMWYLNNNGAGSSTPGFAVLNANSSTINLYRDSNLTSWTNTGGKSGNFTLEYEA